MSQHTHEAPAPTVSLVESDGSDFWLDREGTTELISALWDIHPNNHEAWWIGAFGTDLASSVETLSRVVFSPRRGLVRGPALEILVLPVVPDSPAHPVMVGVVDGNGPIVCRGVEDLAETLPNAFGKGPDHVIGALEKLLEIASGLVPETESASEPDKPVAIGLGLSAPFEQEARVLGI